MKLMKRNLSSIWYCLYQGNAPVYDEDGYETGEPTVSYAEPVKMMANVSPATGIALREMFGNLESYDKIIITDDMNCPIDENTVLFIDVEPEYEIVFHSAEIIPMILGITGTGEEEGTQLINNYQYVVKRVAKSLNYISYAVSKVKVSS